MIMFTIYLTKYICRRKLYFHVIADNQQLFSRLVNSTHKWPDTYRKKVKFMMHDVWYPPVSLAFSFKVLLQNFFELSIKLNIKDMRFCLCMHALELETIYILHLIDFMACGSKYF